MPTQLADNARKAHDSVIVPRARTAVAEIYLVLGHWENEASNIASFSGGKCFWSRRYLHDRLHFIVLSITLNALKSTFGAAPLPGLDICRQRETTVTVGTG